MTQLTLELSQLEVEPIELEEMGSSILQREQNSSLETLTTAEGQNDVLAVLTLTSALPVNSGCVCSCVCGVCNCGSCGCSCACSVCSCGSCGCSCACGVCNCK